jgi:hypothetical protein
MTSTFRRSIGLAGRAYARVMTTTARRIFVDLVPPTALTNFSFASPYGAPSGAGIFGRRFRGDRSRIGCRVDGSESRADLVAGAPDRLKSDHGNARPTRRHICGRTDAFVNDVGNGAAMLGRSSYRGRALSLHVDRAGEPFGDPCECRRRGRDDAKLVAVVAHAGTGTGRR